MKTQTVIPAGYRITVETWENDGDSNNTKVQVGLTKVEASFLADACRQFKSCNNRDAGVGNMYDPDTKKLQIFEERMVELSARHPEMKNSEKYKDYFESEENISEAIHELLYDFSLTGGEFYTRVCDSFKVEYIAEDIYIDDVTEEFSV